VFLDCLIKLFIYTPLSEIDVDMTTKFCSRQVSVGNGVEHPERVDQASEHLEDGGQHGHRENKVSPDIFCQ